MDEHEGLRLAFLAMKNDTRIDLNLPLRSLWLIVNALQLTETHPGLNDFLKVGMTDIGRHIQGLIVAELPEVAELLEMGWQRKYDHVDTEQDDPAAPEGWFDSDDDYEDTARNPFERSEPTNEGDMTNQRDGWLPYTDDEIDQLFPGKIGD